MSSDEVLLLCRVCANPSDDGAMVRLFGDDGDGPLALAEIFLQVSGIAIQAGDARLPKSCCQRCKNRLQEVDELRTLCLESDRKLRKMIDDDMKEEKEEDLNESGIDAVPKVELVEVNESFSQWDDMDNKLDSSDDDSVEPEPEEITPPKRKRGRPRKCDSERQERKEKRGKSPTKAENGDDHDFSDDSQDDDSDFVTERTPKKVGRKKKDKPVSTEPKVLKKRGPKPKIRDPEEHKERKKKEKLEKGSESHMCISCGKVYKSAYALREHETSHSNEKNFKCEICSQEFSRRNVYKYHVKRHETEGTFKCDECDKTFHMAKLLKQHVQIHHRGERPFQCKQCPKTYPRASSLFIHVRSIHEGIKKKQLKCEICMRTFGCKYGYQRHMNAHQGIKLNQCPHCGNKYEFKAYVLQHIAEKHPETVDNLQRCAYCGVGYSSDGYYRKHVIKRHSEHLEQFDLWLKAKREAMQPGAQNTTIPSLQDISATATFT